MSENDKFFESFDDTLKNEAVEAKNEKDQTKMYDYGYVDFIGTPVNLLNNNYTEKLNNIYYKEARIWNVLQTEYDLFKNTEIEILFLSALGSMNYNMFTDKSDVDIYAVYIPKVKNLSCNYNISGKTYNRNYFTNDLKNPDKVITEKYEVKLFPIQHFFNKILQEDLNSLEVMFTKYRIINPNYIVFMEGLFEIREYIAHYNPVAFYNKILGNILTNYKKLTNKIEKSGQDEFSIKELYHMYRLEYMGHAYKHAPYSYLFDMKKLAETKYYTIEEYKDGIFLREDANKKLKVFNIELVQKYFNAQINELLREEEKIKKDENYIEKYENVIKNRKMIKDRVENCSAKILKYYIENEDVEKMDNLDLF